MNDPAPLSDVLLRQSQAWRRGDRVSVEDVLARYPHLAADDNAVLDLIYNEVVLREEAGEKPALGDYLKRFPKLETDLKLQFEVDQALTIDDLTAPAANGNGAALTQPAHQLLQAPPDWLHGLELVEEVGRGAMGTVWRAWQPSARRVVAVKLLALDVPAGRVQTEIGAVTRLSHPNVLPIFEVREDNGRTAIVLEYADGGSLARRLAGKPQPPRNSAQLVETLAWAMAHAHARGVVHRDLKPSNVLLFGDKDLALGQCVPRIGDFGLAKLLESDQQLTRTNDVLGTPSYMAPEQTGGQNVGPPADIYALGAILYECLTGRPPFLGQGVLDTLEQLRHQEPVPPSSLQPKTPRDLEVICLKCLHKTPSRRYASAKELAEDLRRFQTGEPVRALPVGWGEHVWKWSRRHPATAALAAFSVAAALIFVVGGVVVNQMLRRERDVARQKAGELDRKAIEREEQLRQMRRLLYTTQLLRVGAVWPTDPQQGLRMLEDPRACPPDLRCFTWGVLYSQCKRYRDEWPAHSATVTALAVSADSKLVATATQDGQVRLWTADGEPRGTLHEHSGPVAALAFSPDGLTLASGGHDGKIKLWDLREGSVRGTIRVPASGRVAGLAFHPSGKWLASNSGAPNGAGTLQFWDVRKLEGRRVFSTETQPLCVVAISPDGTLIACADRDNVVRVYHTGPGTLIARLRNHSSPVTALSFASHGQRLVSGSLDGNARLWDVENARELDSIDAGLGAVTALSVHPDGKSVALATTRPEDPEEGPDLQVWDLVNRRLDDARRAHDGGIGGLAYAPDGKSLYTAGRDRTVKTWDHPGRRERVQMLDPVGQPGTVALSRDGRTLAWVRRDPPQGPGNTIDLFDLHEGPAGTIRGRGRTFRCVAVLADGHTIVSSSGADDEPADLILWDARTKWLTGALPGHRSAVTAPVSGPRPNDLVSASLDGTVKVWDTKTGKERLALSDKGVTWRAVAFSDGGGSVAAGGVKGKTGVVHVWDARDGGTLRRFETKAPVRCLALSPDGETVAWSAGGGEVRLTGETEVVLETGMKEVAWVAFSPDGRTLAVAGSSTGVKLWDVAGAQERATLPGHRGGACFAGLAADGKTLFSAGVAGHGRLWHRTGQSGSPMRVNAAQ